MAKSKTNTGQRRRAETVEIYFDSGREGIRDNQGTEYTPEEAKQAYEAGKFNNWNRSFMRLANNDFDVEKTLRELDGTD